MQVFDAWTQLLPPYPPDSPAADIFRRYGRESVLDRGATADDLLAEMDAHGIERALVAAKDTRAVAKAVLAHPDRFVGQVKPEPRPIMGAVREVRRAADEFGCRAVRFEPFLYDLPPSDRTYYPVYATCAELGLAVQIQVGHTGPPQYPSEPGRPIHVDRVAVDFPELRIVCGHIGWPWTEEMIAVAWKHPNVYVDTSAHLPKHYPAEFVRFLRTFGQDKVLFASDWPLVSYERLLREVDDVLALPDDVKHKFLWSNARRALDT